MLNEEILRKAQEGDRQSIEVICSTTWETVYRYIYFKVQNRQEAEDITQETFIKAISYMKKNTIRSNSFASFVKKIALNTLRDKWRIKKRHGPPVWLGAINPKESAIPDHTEIVALRELIYNGMNSLNDDQHTVIELRIIQGYSVQDTAKIMGKKEGTVRVIQYRALHSLAKFLDKHYYQRRN